ncbi:MAG: hypothetical protein U1F43_18635 [Myxococcota bacterium]
MSLPQQRLPGTTYFVTMGCDRRESRLVPTDETNAAFAVALEDARDRHGLQLVAVSTNLNHYHAVVHDPRGAISDFLRDAHAVMARFGNARDGARGQGFWDRQQADTQALGDADAVVSKVAYTIANPTTSFLVARPEMWAGIVTRVEDLGRWRGPVYERPATFFRAAGRVSEVVELASELPPMVLDAYGIEGFQRRVRAEVERRVAEAQREAVEKGHGFMGNEAARSRSVWSRPNTPSPRTVGDEAEPRTRVAASRKTLLRAMLEQLLEFRRRHRFAWERYRAGLEAVFPAGTWFAWRFYGAERASGSAPWVGSTA